MRAGPIYCWLKLKTEYYSYLVDCLCYNIKKTKLQCEGSFVASFSYLQHWQFAWVTKLTYDSGFSQLKATALIECRSCCLAWLGSNWEDLCCIWHFYKLKVIIFSIYWGRFDPFILMLPCKPLASPQEWRADAGFLVDHNQSPPLHPLFKIFTN